MTADEIKIAGEILQRHLDNPNFSVWDASLASMDEYASLKVTETTKWTYVRDEIPPLNTQVLASDCDGTVYLTTWRPAYNIFTCQYKTDNSLDWQWKLI